MDEGSHILWLVIVVLLGFAVYFAAAETAFASVSRIRIRTRLERGDARAKRAMSVLENFDKAITTALIGTNIVHLSIAALVTILVTRNWGITAVPAGTVATTLVVFLLGEMLPKSIAKKYSERLALATASSLCFFMLIFTPVSRFLTAVGRAVAGLTRGDTEVSVTEDELYDIIEDMTDDGALDSQQGKLISSALEFSDVTAETVLTARVDLAAVDVNWSGEEILSFIREQRHSRLPVYDGSVDHIVGILQIRKYIREYIRCGRTPELRPLLDEAFFVHGSMKIDELLSLMSTNKLNMAVVTDSYGGTRGIVTVEDILEELVGEIWDEDDVVEESFVPLGGGRFEIDAGMTVGAAFSRMEFRPAREDPELDHKHMGEWAYEQFGRIPTERDSFRYEALEVRISDVHQNRIRKLTARVLPEDTEKGGAV